MYKVHGEILMGRVKRYKLNSNNIEAHRRDAVRRYRYITKGN